MRTTKAWLDRSRRARAATTHRSIRRAFGADHVPSFPTAPPSLGTGFRGRGCVLGDLGRPLVAAHLLLPVSARERRRRRVRREFRGRATELGTLPTKNLGRADT